VHDWAHNVRSPECADAILAAHQEIGLRGRFSYGTGQGHPADRTADLADLARVAGEWFDGSRLPLMHLGLAGRPPGATGESVFRPEYEAARSLGLPVSYHANSTRAQGELRMIERLAAESMLDPHTQLIHALYTTAGERAAVRDSGASVSLSPWSELLIGYGMPPVQDMIDSGVLVTLSVDTLSLTGTADLWSAIRLGDRAAAGRRRAGARGRHQADAGAVHSGRRPVARARRRDRLAHPGQAGRPDPGPGRPRRHRAVHRPDETCSRWPPARRTSTRSWWTAGSSSGPSTDHSGPAAVVAATDSRPARPAGPHLSRAGPSADWPSPAAELAVARLAGRRRRLAGRA
jgi:hypothetical protein